MVELLTHIGIAVSAMVVGIWAMDKGKGRLQRHMRTLFEVASIFAVAQAVNLVGTHMGWWK